MNPVYDLSQRSPEEIQSRIAETRTALDHKLDKLGERLDPSTRLAEVKDEVSARVERIREDVSARAPQLLAWGAVGAVAAGAVMAATGWRHLHQDDSDMYVCGRVTDMMSDNEPLGDGIVSGPTTEPRL
jgi:hypothetical protein